MWNVFSNILHAYLVGVIVELEVILSMNKLVTFLECNKDKENSLNARSSDAKALGNSL